MAACIVCSSDGKSKGFSQCYYVLKVIYGEKSIRKIIRMDNALMPDLKYPSDVIQ